MNEANSWQINNHNINESKLNDCGNCNSQNHPSVINIGHFWHLDNTNYSRSNTDQSWYNVKFVILLEASFFPMFLVSLSLFKILIVPYLIQKLLIYFMKSLSLKWTNVNRNQSPNNRSDWVDDESNSQMSIIWKSPVKDSMEQQKGEQVKEDYGKSH